MLSKYVLRGRFTAGAREAFEGSVEVFLGEQTVSVGPQRGLGSVLLHVTPFHGSMFFGRTYSEGCEIVEKGYELVLSGTNLGAYEEGGGPDGDFSIFKVKGVEIRGSFDPSGLTIGIHAKTWPGAEVCYGLRETREDAYAPIEVVAEFVVPPEDLSGFLALRVPLNSDAFAKLQCPRVNSNVEFAQKPRP